MNGATACRPRQRVAIVGSGIVGLAHAWAAARRGHEVIVIERDSAAVGASIRNFGLGLVLGQPQGDLFTLAMESRRLWLDLLPRIGAWHKAQGSLTVATDAAEWAVLQAFQATLGAAYDTQLQGSGSLATHGLKGLGALYSPHEIALSSRAVLPAFTHYLAAHHGVRFLFETLVQGLDGTRLHTTAGLIDADRVFVCAGHDHQTLLADAFRPLGLQRCALQMMRVAAPGLRLGPALMTGLSTLHYASFSQSDALAGPLSQLSSHVQATRPDVLAHGVHLIVQQIEPDGDLIIGDSHHRAFSPSPFCDDRIDQRLLEMAESLLQRPLRVLERWQGVYGSGPRPYEVIDAHDGVTAVAITAGIGMSVSLALAERLLSR